MMEPTTPEYTQEILQKFQDLPPDADAAVIEETAQRLRTMNWEPTLLAAPPGFLTITKNNLMQFIANLVNNGKNHTKQDLSLLLYHFTLLQKLRTDDAEAWDEVNELMEDD